MQEDLRKFATVTLAVPAAFMPVVCLAALPEAEWHDAHVPIVEYVAHTPPGFDARDPMVVVVYSNTSDRCQVRIEVPGNEEERRWISPAVRFDGSYALRVQPEDSDWMQTSSCNVVPLGCLTQAFRIADAHIVPPDWRSMTIEVTEAMSLRSTAYSFDRRGGLVSQIVYESRSYGSFLSNVWRSSTFRSHVRSQAAYYLTLSRGGSTSVSSVELHSLRTGESVFARREVASNAEVPGVDTADDSLRRSKVSANSEFVSRLRRHVRAAAAALAGVAVLMFVLRAFRVSKESPRGS